MTFKSKRFDSLVVSVIAGAAIYGVALATLTYTRDTGGLAAIWLPNALLLAAILCFPQTPKSLLIAVGALAGLAASLQAGRSVDIGVRVTLVNMSEVLVAAFLLRHEAGVNFTKFGQVIRFASAVSVAAAVGTVIAAYLRGPEPLENAEVLLSWWSRHVLGMFVVVPPALIGLAAWHRDPAVRIGRSTLEMTGLLAIVLVMSVVVFLQSSYPLLFLPLATLLLATYRLGVGGAVWGLLLIAAVGCVLTSFHLGPITLIDDGADRLLFFQFYLVIVFACALPLASLLATQRELTAQLARSDRLHRTIIARSPVLIFETDALGRFTFVSPVWHEMTGESTAAAIGVSALRRVHDADRDTVSTLASQEPGDRGERSCEFRYRAADGSHRFAVAHVTPIWTAAGALTGYHGVVNDVTERLEALKKLADSERLYRLLADNSNDMIVCIGLDGVRRYVSPASRAVLGFHPEELVGETPAGAIHPDDRARVVDVCRSLLDGAVDPVCVYRQRHRDGHYVWLEASYRLVVDPTTGVPQEFIASARDVSRRQAAELQAIETAARMHEHHRLLTMAEAVAHVGHWRLHLASQSLFWSAEVYRIHGCDPARPPGLEDAISAYHPDDRARVAAHVQAAVETGLAYDFTARIVRPDGQVRDVVSHGNVEQAPNGDIIGLFGVFQDVTDRARTEAALREGERRYRLLAENATDVIFRLDGENRFTYVSPSVRTVTGVVAEMLIGKSPIDAIHRDDRAAVQEALDAVWNGSVPQCVVSYRTKCADGSWRWVETSASLAEGADRSTLELVGAARDISERKRFEMELVAARERAERSALDSKHVAETDELTGLASRRAFMQRLKSEVETSTSQTRSLAVAIFDIDHFKRVNDTHGHSVGDAVLQLVSAAATHSVRREDMVGRLGGEEFGVIMPGTAGEAAVLVADRIRRAIKANAMFVRDRPAVTVSVGVASLTVGQDASALLAAADSALYAAKNTGRNKLCSAA